jgi:nucleoside-diphosphate kinase
LPFFTPWRSFARFKGNRLSRHGFNQVEMSHGKLAQAMTDDTREDTLVIIKPDSFWRNLHQMVEDRLKTLGLKIVSECTLADGQNLPEEKWQEFYLPAIGDKPAVLKGTSKYMAYGPVKVLHLNGADAVQKVRKLVGVTRPWQAEKGTIRGDFWVGAEEANAPYRLKFQQAGDDKFLFNMIHASDSGKSFAREVLFFDQLSRRE